MNRSLNDQALPIPVWLYYLLYLPDLVLVLGLTSLFRIGERWYRMRATVDQLRAERDFMELQHLKARLHPHFLFNTLNNLYVFALEGHKATPEMILRLSNILRYLTEGALEGDSELSLVSTEREWEAVKDLLYLHRLKLEQVDEVQDSVSLNASQETLARTRLPKGCLLTLLENAFKHGRIWEHGGGLEMTLQSKNGKLTVHCSNTLDSGQEAKQKGEAPDGTEACSGRGGLHALKRQLALMGYADSDHFIVKTNATHFTVSFAIPQSKSTGAYAN